MKDRKWEKTNLYKIAQTSEENWIFFLQQVLSVFNLKACLI